MDKDGLNISADISAADADEYIRVYGGNNYFLILSAGRLYGLGRNEYGQICRKTVPFLFRPRLMASCVISAAAGWHFSGFVTEKGEVYIVHAGDITLVPDVRNIRKLYATQNVFFAEDCDGNILRIIADEKILSYPRKVKLEVSPVNDSPKSEFSGNQYHMCRPDNLGLDNNRGISLSDYKKIVKGKLHSFAVGLRYDGRVDFIDPFFGKLDCDCKFESISDIAMSQNEDFLFSTKSNKLLFVSAGLSIPVEALNNYIRRDIDEKNKLSTYVRTIDLP